MNVLDWVVLAIVLLSVLLAAPVGHAQQESFRPMPARAREALRLAIDCYKKGDHETAALYLPARAPRQAAPGRSFGPRFARTRAPPAWKPRPGSRARRWR